jgi:hypothetical protein
VLVFDQDEHLDALMNFVKEDTGFAGHYEASAHIRFIAYMDYRMQRKETTANQYIKAIGLRTTACASTSTP